jgi:hypothetical protein
VNNSNTTVDLRECHKIGAAVIAHHEAGHAVVGVLTGRVPRYSTLRPRRDDRHGITRWRHPLPPAANALISVAGPLAEAAHLAGGPGTAFDAHQFTNTLGRAVDNADWQPLHDISHHLGAPRAHAALRLANRLVLDNWDAVRRVADELTTRGTLTGREIQNIVLDASLAGAA